MEGLRTHFSSYLHLNKLFILTCCAIYIFEFYSIISYFKYAVNIKCDSPFCWCPGLTSENLDPSPWGTRLSNLFDGSRALPLLNWLNVDIVENFGEVYCLLGPDAVDVCT